MNTKEFRAISHYIMFSKNIRMKGLAEKAGMNYTYYTRIMKGERDVSSVYAGKLINFAQTSGIDLTKANLDLTDDVLPKTKQEQIQEHQSNARELFTESAMRPGAEFEITTKVTMKNDMITGYNVDLKRIS